MTNYNDGNWWGWNGGECPVHPLTRVDVKMRDGSERSNKNARFWTWREDNDGTIIAFRVIKEHREPREFWIMLPRPGGSFGPIVHAQKPAELDGYYSPIHVREVLE